MTGVKKNAWPMRLWQVNFQVYNALPSFPRPDVIVEEIQRYPSYAHFGAKRQGNPGGQFVITLKGLGGFRLNGKDHRLPPGRGFLANHADPAHAYYYPPEGKEPWIFLWIAMTGAVSERMISEINTRYGYLFTLPLDSGLVERLYARKSERGSVRVLSSPAAAAIVIDVLSSLVTEKEKDSPAEPSSALVRDAQQIILESLGADITVSALSEKLNVTREHLSRVFRERTGVSPGEYIHEKKTRLACRLLREPGVSCKEAAARAGFESIASFNRAFKKALRMTPSEFRSSGAVPAPD
jgi:AraC-like DNA-binding protein